MTFKRRDLFLLGLGAFASTILAQSPGTFTATGNMIADRLGHTATLLTNGKVLIAGGFDFPSASALSRAELYDPSTGTFSATGNLGTPRVGHTATLLPDGRVLVVGSSADGTAEIYDPAAGTFSAVDSITGGSHAVWTTATLLNDGRVLIATGTPPFSCVSLPECHAASKTAGLYDPAAGTFTATGDMFWDHAEPVATLLADGRVMIVEGRDGACEFTVPGAPLVPMACGGTEIYDPATGAFSPTGDVSSGCGWRAYPTSTLLANGQVLVSGGDGGNCLLDSADLYDPMAGRFTPTAKMSLSRSGHTGTLLPNGMVLVAGGGTTGIGITATAELYDPSTGTFTRTGDMIAHRVNFAAALLADGSVLMTGGLGVGSSSEIYHPNVAIPSPVLLSLSGDGQGQGAIQHAGTTRIASADDPAVPGESLSVYLHGLADGSVIPPQVAIGGRLAKISFFGNVPGYPGLNVVNIRMPSGVATGSAVPVRLTYLGRSSNQVTIGVALEPTWQQAITAIKSAAGTDSLNFWQWAYYWQYLPLFSGAPAGFGVVGSISPDVMARIISVGGGDALRNVSAEQWVLYLRSSAIVVRGVVNAASHLAGAIAPGELVIITGSGLGPAQVVSADPDSDGVYAAQLAGTAVLVNGTAVPLVYTSASEVEALVPDSVAGGSAQVTVTYQGLTSASFLVPVAPTAPGIFTQDATGQGHAVTINQKGASNVAAHWEGDVMTLFLTGAGHATLAVAIYGSQQLPITKGPLPGVTQFKVPIVHGADCDLPVMFQVGNATTQPGVTIAIDLCI